MWFQHPINISLKPWCCQRIHSLAREWEVQPWLEATFVLPGASLRCASAQARAVRWLEMTGRLRITCLYTSIKGHIPYFSSGEFLMWETACWRCVKQPPHQATLDLLFLGTWKSRGHKMSSVEPHEVGHLYVQPPMGCREKPLSKRSASQEQTGTTHRGSSAQQRPAVLATQEPARLVGNRIRPRPEVYLQALSSLRLKKRKSLGKAKERNHRYCRNWCLFLICLPAHFV